MTDYSPGMRVIIRDEKWMIKKVENNTLGSKSLHCVGISPLVKDRNSIFISDLEDDNREGSGIVIVDPTTKNHLPYPVSGTPKLRKRHMV